MSEMNANDNAVVTDGDNANAVAGIPGTAATNGANGIPDGAAAIDHVDPTGSPHVAEDPLIEYPDEDADVTVGEMNVSNAADDRLEDSPEHRDPNVPFWNEAELRAAFPNDEARVRFELNLATEIRRLNADLDLETDLGESPSLPRLLDQATRTIAAITDLQKQPDDQGSIDSFYQTERPPGGHMTRSQTRRLSFTPVSARVLEENLRRNRFRTRMLRESEPLRRHLLQAFHAAMDVNNRRWSEGANRADEDQEDTGDQEDDPEDDHQDQGDQQDQGNQDGADEERHLDDDGQEVEFAAEDGAEGQPPGAVGGGDDQDDRGSHRSSRTVQSLASTLSIAADPEVEDKEKFRLFLATVNLLNMAKKSTQQTTEFVR
ncbi:MAG: hypothetical protein ABSA72_13125, partial [Nitrososphaerales archaeon]